MGVVENVYYIIKCLLSSIKILICKQLWSLLNLHIGRNQIQREMIMTGIKIRSETGTLYQYQHWRWFLRMGTDWGKRFSIQGSRVLEWRCGCGYKILDPVPGMDPPDICPLCQQVHKN